MDRLSALKDDKELLEFYTKFMRLYDALGESFLNQFNRLLPFPDLLIDRWEKARKLNFGQNTNIYDSSLIIGDVKVGCDCWIGPNTILDGSGELSIGDYCTISAGVQVYTHDNVKQTLSSKRLPIERAPVIIGNNVYIGPQAIITKNVTIGDGSVIAAGAFVNRNVAANSIVMGQPGRVVGRVELSPEKVNLIYE